ncbi:hypothetical protein [Huintestinicola sp.]|uniref:hypothetical protein n=1 Tax=Huintestinicola sp. TaxID=2981661 RepID=UPI003D7E8E67
MKKLKPALVPVILSLLLCSCKAEIIPLSEAVMLDNDKLSGNLEGRSTVEICDAWGEPVTGYGDIYSYGDAAAVVFFDPTDRATNAIVCGWLEGRYLRDKNDGDMVFVEQDGYIAPTSVRTYDGTSWSGYDFAEFENGDRIKILVEMIAETYPGQATVYAVELIEKGSYDDLDKEQMDRLRELGWAE